MIFVLQHAKDEGAGTLGGYFQQENKKVKIIKLYAGQRLPSISASTEAIVIMGGPMNAYEEKKFPFLKTEDLLIKKALKNNIPLLGICLGAQLIAKALCAKVKKAKCAEIGFKTVTLTAQGKKDNLFKGLKKKLSVFQWHEDTFEIPKDSVLLAHAASCRHQAFRYGDHCYAFQFHIEVDRKMFLSWVKHLKDSFSDNEVLLMKRDFALQHKNYESQAATMYQNLSTYVLRCN